MALNDCRIGRLSKDLEEVVIAEKIEAWERSSLLLKELIKRSLASVELVRYLLESSAQRVARCKCHKTRIFSDSGKDHSKLDVHSIEPRCLGRQGTAAEYRLEIHPLALYFVHRMQVRVEIADSKFEANG